MNKKTLTINELKDLIRHDYQTTSALVKVLVGVGAAKLVGHRPQEAGKRGKPSATYEFERDIDLSLWADEENAPEVENVVDSPVNKE